MLLLVWKCITTHWKVSGSCYLSQLVLCTPSCMFITALTSQIVAQKKNNFVKGKVSLIASTAKFPVILQLCCSNCHTFKHGQYLTYTFCNIFLSYVFTAMWSWCPRNAKPWWSMKTWMAPAMLSRMQQRTRCTLQATLPSSITLPAKRSPGQETRTTPEASTMCYCWLS